MAWAYRRRGRGSIAACCASATICSRVSFPRPSGRGSIAATSHTAARWGAGRPSPGHQAGAPLRQRRRRPSWSWPAHFPRPSGRGSIAATGRPAHRRRTTQLPPAIRPGLHCGDIVQGTRTPTLRGFPRPSGRGSIAASSTSSAWASPQSSSPGHQAGAPLRPSTSRRCPATPHDLPPAIRPGLHCGDGDAADRLGTWDPLPPAIRPGLHCGDDGEADYTLGGATFPRPSGRGSIAAVSRKRRST